MIHSAAIPIGCLTTSYSTAARPMPTSIDAGIAGPVYVRSSVVRSYAKTSGGGSDAKKTYVNTSYGLSESTTAYVTRLRRSPPNTDANAMAFVFRTAGRRRAYSVNAAVGATSVPK